MVVDPLTVLLQQKEVHQQLRRLAKPPQLARDARERDACVPLGSLGTVALTAASDAPVTVSASRLAPVDPLGMFLDRKKREEPVHGLNGATSGSPAHRARTSDVIGESLFDTHVSRRTLTVEEFLAEQEDDGAVSSGTTVEPDEASAMSMSVWQFLGEVCRDESAWCFQDGMATSASNLASVFRDSRPPAAEGPTWTEYVCEVQEDDLPFVLGPFSNGRVCDILTASLCNTQDPPRHLDVTEPMRNRWRQDRGLCLSQFADLDVRCSWPARCTTMVLKYRLSDVNSWDVAQTRYPEGLRKVSQIVPIFTKALANVVGATLAASGYAMAHAERRVKTKLSSAMGIDATPNTESVIDSDAFHWGFATWLRLNGIRPSVKYDPLGTAGTRLRWFLSHTWGMESLPREVAPAEDMRQTPLIVANHISYLDALVLVTLFGIPRVLAKEGTSGVPLIGSFAKAIGMIEVDRCSRESRAAALEAIADHVRTWKPGRRALLLFPEGTTSNGTDILEFRKGAFVHGAPVRPVVLCYTGAWHPANVNFKLTRQGGIAPTSDAEWCEQFLGHFVHSLKVRVLPPYIPNEDERASSKFFAANVREVMAQAYRELQQEPKS